ncbi:hypothetical protein H6F89_28955 [Cyanobacteria bacterium FACHB-63]|nr:hypothetical protein [Cyanobacteria bacterium FACHB-63]
MVSTINRLTIAPLAAFCIAAGVSACSQGTKPTISRGTIFSPTAPGSKLYREVKDRPMIKSFDARR